jgi:hypothetical protein
MRTAPWLVIGGMMTVTAGARQPPVDSTEAARRLHATMIKPASEVVFNVGREAPTNDGKWTAISAAGATLVQSGNLLMLDSPPKNRTKWITLCRQLITAGRAARRQAEARNLGALMRTSDRLIVVCETCHARYRKQGPQE